jgi:hypothetical protein
MALRTIEQYQQMDDLELWQMVYKHWSDMSPSEQSIVYETVAVMAGGKDTPAFEIFWQQIQAEWQEQRDLQDMASEIHAYGCY